MAWVADLQGGPKDAKPLSTCAAHEADQHLSDFTLEVRSWLTVPTASPLSRGREGGRRERGPGGEVQPRIDLGRLPIPGPLLIGRETELARLDAAWEDPSVHVLALVAFGGTGKSALVSRWLDGMSAAGWRGVWRVLDWRNPLPFPPPLARERAPPPNPGLRAQRFGAFGRNSTMMFVLSW